MEASLENELYKLTYSTSERNKEVAGIPKSYEQETAGYTTLVTLDVTGRRVATLLLRDLPPQAIQELVRLNQSPLQTDLIAYHVALTAPGWGQGQVVSL